MSRVLSVIIATCALSSTVTAGPREQEEVRRRETAYYKSYIGGDLKTFADILASGFTYQHPSGKTLTEEQFLDLFRSGALVVTKADPPVSSYRDYGDTIITHGQSSVEATVGGKPANGVIRFVNVWRREGKVWRMHHRNSQFLP